MVPQVSFPPKIDIEGTEREYLGIARAIRSNDTFLISDTGARQGAVNRSWRTFRAITRRRSSTASPRRTRRGSGRGITLPRCRELRRSSPSTVIKRDSTARQEDPTGRTIRHTDERRKRRRRRSTRISKGRLRTRRISRVSITHSRTTRPTWRISASTDSGWSITGWRPRASELEHVSTSISGYKSRIIRDIKFHLYLKELYFLQ